MLSRLSLPMQLVVVIVVVMLFGSYLNEDTVRFFYTISTAFKQILSFLLPFIIFAFVFSGIVSMKKNAPVILAILVSCVIFSNGFVATLVYGFSRLFLSPLVGQLCVDGLFCEKTVEPFYSFEIPTDICTPYQFYCTHISSYLSIMVLLIGVLLGLYASMYSLPVFERFVQRAKEKLEIFFTTFFIPFLPLYVFGFLLKNQYEGVLGRLIENYGSAFFLIVVLQISYLCLFYFVAVGFDIQKTVQAIRNAIASYLTAFTTMSSTATVPVSVVCAEKNTGNRSLAQMAMPIMANVHLVGDSIGTPILAMVTMLLFSGNLPDFSTYLVFVFYFCFSMFAVSGVPGGGIIVMLPVLQAYLGFTSEMVGIMIALYMLLDAFGTAANVMGDGALVIIVNKIITRLKLV
jgi:Na+/H+-dicarboxylate symporter